MTVGLRRAIHCDITRQFRADIARAKLDAAEWAG